MIGFRRIGALGVAFIGLLGLALAAPSCGGGGSATPDSGGTGAAGTTGGGGTPVAQCKDLISTLCTRSSECGTAVLTPQELADCKTLENVEFGCDRATSTGFAPCLTDVKLLSCGALFGAQGLSTPTTCDEPINTIPLSVAQMKCAALGHVICQRIFVCNGNTAPTQADQDGCDQEAFFAIQCNFAVDVGATYDQCLADFPNSACPPPPDAGTDGGMMGTVPSCTGVIKGPLP